MSKPKLPILYPLPNPFSSSSLPHLTISVPLLPIQLLSRISYKSSLIFLPVHLYPTNAYNISQQQDLFSASQYILVPGIPGAEPATQMTQMQESHGSFFEKA